MCCQVVGEPADWRGHRRRHDLQRFAGAEQVENQVVNHEAVKIGDLEKYSEAFKVVKPKINTEIFPNAAVWEGMYELTRRFFHWQ